MSRLRTRSGVAAVELAVLLPLLLLLLLGVWEVGRMVEVQQLLANAAREGGRQASTGAKTLAQVKDAATLYLSQNGIDAAKATATLVNLTDSSRADPTQAQQLDQFRLTVSIPVDSIRWALLPRVTGTAALSVTVDWYSMRDVPITVDYQIPTS